MKIKVLLISLCWISLFGINIKAQTAIERLKIDYPAVMEHYAKQLENQHADYIIAIDVSGTMNKHKDIVLPALNSFLNSLPEGDFVSIIKFGTKAEEFGLSGVINQATRPSFQNTLSRVYDRDPAFIQRTDLGAMCDAVLAQMSRPGANNLQYVFMFTDFINEPGVGGSSWKTLQERVGAISKINIVRAMAMQLPGANTGRDIQLVRNVFPNLQTINVDNSAQLNDWFEGQKAEITKVRLMDLIRGDFDRWYNEGKIQTELSINLNRNLNLHYTVDGDVPAFVNGLFVSSADLVSKSNNIERLALATDSLYKGRDIKENIGSIKFLNKKPFQRDVSATVSVTCRPTFIMADKEGEPSFANEIHRLGLENDLTRTSELTAKSNFVIGWNIWLFCICCGLLVAWLFLFIMNTARTHCLGYLNLLIRDDKGNTQVHRLPNKRVVTIGSDNCDISVPSIASSLVLKGYRGSPLSLIKRKVKAKCKCSPTSTDFISIGGTPKKNNKFHRLKLQQAASISSVGVLNFSIGESDANKSNYKNVIACALFVLATLVAMVVCLFL